MANRFIGLRFTETEERDLFLKAIRKVLVPDRTHPANIPGAVYYYPNVTGIVTTSVHSEQVLLEIEEE